MDSEISALGYFGMYSSYAFYATAVILVAYERYWNHKNDSKLYDSKETLTNLSIIVGYLIAQSAFLAWNYFLLEPFYKWRLLTIPNSIWGVCLVIPAVDFIYYWEHRLMHVVKPLWAVHIAHHSAGKFNLTAAFRLNWIAPAITPFFLIPLVFVGFSPRAVLLSIAFGQMYQFWCHTQAINRVPMIEGILNTPSAHRVHHGSNPLYLDRNFGGIFMIWDRLFGTYVSETEPPRYGITSGFVSYNPIKLMFHGFYDLIKGNLTYKG